MTIWIDADACPRAVKEVVFRRAERGRLRTVLVANSFQQVPRFNWITAVKVDKGMDVADDYIVQHCETGDLVITQDVPLAAEIIEKGVSALSIRGEEWNENNIRERLSIRDMMTEARASGVVTGGPPPFDQKAKQRFANAFDRWLARR